MSKFQIPESLDVSSPDVIRSFIKDRKKHFNSSMAKAGVLPFSAQYARNMAHCLSESPSSIIALDSDDLEPPMIDTSKMTARFVITTSARDRHGDIVIPRGCVNHLKNYSRNPRVFFGHKTEELPIASARDAEGNLTLEIFDDKIYSTAFFHGETRESEIVFRLIARKELQASSIGFLPVRASIVMDDENEDLMDLETGEEILDFRGNNSHSVPALRFLEWDMIEWSVVPIPANQEALAAHLSRGHVDGEKISPSIRKTLSSYVPLSTKKSVSLSSLKDSYFLNPESSENKKTEVQIVAVPPQGPAPGTEEVSKDLLVNPVQVTKEVDKEELDEIYSKYKKETNMSYTELKAWSENKCSKKASLSKGPINRNLELLSTPKNKWTQKHITWANKTIAFNSRMRKMPQGKPVSKECQISKRDISLKNWAWNPAKAKGKKQLDEETTQQPFVEFATLEKKNPPAPPGDQISGSDANKPGSASDDKGKIEISESTKKTLQTKVEEHNKKMNGKPAWAKTTLNAVKAVYRRGAGAFSTSHRPNMTRAQWAFARVNAFLYLCKNGKPENKNYVSDNDLLHKDHPRFSKEKKSTKSFESKGIQGFSLFGKVLANEYKAVSSEVQLAMAVLLHLQDGLLPEKIKFGVYIVLAKHYKLLDIPSPDYRKFSSLEEIKATFPEIDTKEFTIVATNEENWIKSAMEELVSPPAQGKPGKKKKKEDEDEEVKAASPDEEEEKETDTDEEAAKADSDDDMEEKSEDEDDEEKAVSEDEEEEKDSDEDPTHKAIKSMSEVLHSMHESCASHTELLKSIHDKLDQCCNALAAKAEDEEKAEQEDEMKTLIASLATLKNNQDALNKRLFEVTGRR